MTQKYPAAPPLSESSFPRTRESSVAYHVQELDPRARGNDDGLVAGLLRHYERVADAPDAIVRLRRFVLDLAVRGKLVQQEKDSEQAIPQAQQAVAERSTKRRSEKASEFNAVESHELPFPIPATWLPKRLGEVATCLDYMRRPINSTERELRVAGKSTSELFPYYGATQQQGWIDDYIFDEELVLLGEDGVPFFDELRAKAYLISGKSWVNNHAHVFRGVLASNAFLVHYLNVFDYSGRVVGATRSKLNQARALDIPVMLPPLAEQHRIVAKVDELMALCDQLEAARLQREATRDRLAAASLARLNTPDLETFQADARFAIGTALPALTTRRDQIQQLRQTILNLAASARLIPQVEDGESADDLVKRAREVKRVAEAGEGIRSRAPIEPTSRENIGFAMPRTWAIAAFDDVFVIVSGVTKGNKIPASEAINTPYLRVANVQRGHLDLRVIKTIPVRALDVQRYALRSGDVLMTEGGDWDKLGRAAVWSDEIPGCIHQNHVFRVRAPSPDILPRWITTYVNSPIGRAFFEAASKQTTNLASINMTQLRACPIPVPPRSEQHRIVAKVDELLALCDQLEASLSRGENTRSRLLDALLQNALQPSRDNVIDLEAARRRRLEQRQAVGCRIVQRLAGKPGFGRVRAVKLQYLAEAHCGAALGGEWRRADYGPYDDWIRTFETHAEAAGWFSTRERASPDGNKRFEYQPRPGLSAKAGEAAAALGDMAGEFERVLDLFAGLDTEDSEIVATLYAAWNDLLLEGKPVTDDIVIAEFREHWGVPRKAGFDSERLRTKLDWMRRNRLVPKGQGPSTLRQQELF